MSEQDCKSSPTGEASAEPVDERPWHKADGGPLNNCMRVFSEDRELIAIVGNSDQSMKDIERNATLIAAAPKLLKALRAIVRHQEMVAGNLARLSTPRHIALLAIEEATGERQTP